MKNIIILILFVMLIIMSYFFITAKNNFQERFLELKNHYQQETNDLINMERNEFRDVGKKINIDSMRIASNQMNSEIKGSVCIRIPKKYCESCLDNYIAVFSDLLSDQSKINKYVLVNYTDPLMIKFLETRHPELKGCVINIADIGLKMDSLKTPYVFFVGNDGKIINLHLTNKSFKERYETYIKEMCVMVNNFCLDN